VPRRPGKRGCDGAAAGDAGERDGDRPSTTTTPTSCRYRAASASGPCWWTSWRTRRRTTSDSVVSRPPRQRTTISPAQLSRSLTLTDTNCYCDTPPPTNTIRHVFTYSYTSRVWRNKYDDDSRPYSHRHTHKHLLNPLTDTGNYSATSNNIKLVHWPLMGGLLHLVQRRGD